MDVKNTHSITKTEISVFGRQALDAERRRSPYLAGKVLIEKLNHYGVRGVAENWIKSYLSGINQFVKLGECSSDVIQISCGYTTRFSTWTQTVYFIY